MRRNLIIPHGFEANYTIGFVRGLAANGIPFRVVSSDGVAERLTQLGIVNVNLRGSHDPKRSRFQKALNLFRYYIHLMRTIFEYRGSTVHFTGIFNNSLILLESLVLGSWMRLWAGRYIYTAHNALPHNRKDNRFFRAIHRWIYRMPDTVVVHAPEAARQIAREFRVEAYRLKVIPIGLNEEVPMTSLTRQEARCQLGFQPEDRVALFFGKVDHYKGTDVLVDAWERVQSPQTRLAIVGWCLDIEYRTQVRRMIERSPRRSSIEWREGILPNEDIEPWLKACDVMVLPYRHIYQSGVLFLCLRFGVPIIATDVGSMREFVDPSSGLITTSNDARGIAEAIDRFFSNRDCFRPEDIAGRAQKYRWDRLCKELVPLYATI